MLTLLICQHLLSQGEISAPKDEEDNVQVLCCSFQRYLHCSEQVVNSTCGAHTAGFTKQFLDRMSGPLVQQHCQHYEHGSEMCPNKEGEDTGLQSPRYGAEAGSGAPGLGVSLLLSSSIVLIQRFF